MGGYTKGPWFVTYTRNGTANVGPSHNCTVAALLISPVGEMEANARLIAAAPDLLNALMTLADVAEDRGIPCDAARAAIAKATGEQP